MKNFAIIGVGGYVAPKHLTAIHDLGHDLKCACDISDSVGILDRYFPNCLFFKDEHAFDRHIVKNEKIDFMTVCTPNYLHEAHSKLGMRLGADIICEKPLATTVENLLQLKTVEQQTGKKVYSILQLRLHPSIKLIKQMLPMNKKYTVELKYYTPRGQWYFTSWKGSENRSGGIETNIGIHFFDMVIWLFGDVKNIELIKRDDKHSVGNLELEHANVHWDLSLDRNDLPPGSNFYRNMTIDGMEVRFDNVFSELHTESYREILKGNGFGIDDSLKAIDVVQKIREGR